MKKYILFYILICGFSFAQDFDVDYNNLLKSEQSKFQKLLNFNVNPNTLNYDLRYQRMELTIDPAQFYVAGSVTSHFKPTSNMSSIYFDLTNQLTVSQVTYHGNNVTFQQLASKEIKIDFPATIPANTLDSLTITYSGVPDNANGAVKTGTQGTSPIFSTLSEPYGAHDWFPTKQSLNDKIEKFEFKIKTPSQYDVAANGLLISESLINPTQKLTHWKTQYAMPAYLAALSITEFVKINDQIGNPPFPFVNYIYSSSNADATIMSNINWTKQAMTTFENYFGPYPFRNEKYGHMEFNFYGVCMEHQTMSSMSGWNRRVIAHELAHQWFGDKITCKTWNDIWINEGFATFGEHVVNEHLLMTDAQFKSYLAGQVSYITSSTGGSTYVSDANLTSVNAIFNGRLSYAKGGYIVRMMKWVLGDTFFYQALKDYHQRPNLAYGYASTDDLKASFLQSSNHDFTEFFNDWLYGQGYPTYSILWKQSAISNDLTINVNQTQSHSSVSFFEMPLPIKVNGTNGEVQYLKLNNTTNNQYFTVNVPFPIASIEFNYDYQIIERNSTVAQDANLATNEVSKEEFQIYPNPVSNDLYLKGIKEKEAFKIYSADGRLIISSDYEPNTSIDVSGLTPGVYFLHILDEKYKFIKK